MAKFDVACSHNRPDEYTALVVLSICSKKTICRIIICCPIFELPDRMRSNSTVLSARSWQTGLDGWGVIVFNILLQEGFLISTQTAKRLENIWSRPSIIPEKILGAFPQHPQPKKCHCPRSCCCSMRICSRIFSAQPGIAFPSKSPMPCSPHHAWMNFLSFLRASKIENQKIPKISQNPRNSQSPGSLLGARHFDRYKTMYPRVSVMTLQSPHHAAREKHLDWWLKFFSGKSEIPWIHVEFTDWLYTSKLNKYIYIYLYPNIISCLYRYYTINLNLQIVFCILSNGSRCYHAAILIETFHCALHVARVMYPVSYTDQTRRKALQCGLLVGVEGTTIVDEIWHVFRDEIWTLRILSWTVNHRWTDLNDSSGNWILSERFFTARLCMVM